jgi:hypothetical protein
MPSAIPAGSLPISPQLPPAERTLTFRTSHTKITNLNGFKPSVQINGLSLFRGKGIQTGRDDLASANNGVLGSFLNDFFFRLVTARCAKKHRCLYLPFFEIKNAPGINVKILIFTGRTHMKPKQVTVRFHFYP